MASLPEGPWCNAESLREGPLEAADTAESNDGGYLRYREILSGKEHSSALHSVSPQPTSKCHADVLTKIGAKILATKACNTGCIIKCYRTAVVLIHEQFDAPQGSVIEKRILQQHVAQALSAALFAVRHSA